MKSPETLTWATRPPLKLSFRLYLGVVMRRRAKGMSFREAFESEEYRQFLECRSPTLPCNTVLLADGDRASDSCQLAPLLDQADIDEEVIISRFRDYLLSAHNEEGAIRRAGPGAVLEDYLNSFGPREPQFWEELPMTALYRVTDGKMRISSRLSDRLSRVFGTRSNFWSDIQAEYDRWKSGLICDSR